MKIITVFLCGAAIVVVLSACAGPVVMTGGSLKGGVALDEAGKPSATLEGVIEFSTGRSQAEADPVVISGGSLKGGVALDEAGKPSATLEGEFEFSTRRSRAKVDREGPAPVDPVPTDESDESIEFDEEAARQINEETRAVEAALPTEFFEAASIRSVPAASADLSFEALKLRWPRDTRDQKELLAFYGAPSFSNLVKVPSPWTLQVAVEGGIVTRDYFWAHKKVAPALARVLAKIANAYTPEEIKALGLNRFGGDYNPRKMRGSRTRWSLHAWGAAFDFDAENNQYEWGADRAHLARPEYDAFWGAWESEGFFSLGRHGHGDWMHIQAAWRPEN